MDYQLHYSPLLYQLSYQGMDDAMVNFTSLQSSNFYLPFSLRSVAICEVHQNAPLKDLLSYGN